MLEATDVDSAVIVVPVGAPNNTREDPPPHTLLNTRSYCQGMPPPRCLSPPDDARKQSRGICVVPQVQFEEAGAPSEDIFIADQNVMKPRRSSQFKRRSSQFKNFMSVVDKNTDRGDSDRMVTVVTAWNICIAVATLFATIGDSIYEITATTDSGDVGMGVAMLVLVVMYSIDMIMTVVSQGYGYLVSVYFVLDCLSLVDLAITGASYVNTADNGVLFFRIMRLSRVAKMSSKAGRLARAGRIMARLKKMFVKDETSSVNTMFTEEQLINIITHMDSNGDGTVSFEEFLVACEASYGMTLEGPELERVKYIFKQLDRDNDGKLNEEELMETFESYETDYVSESGEKGLRIERQYNQRATHQFVIVVFLIFFVPTIWETLWARPVESDDAYALAAILSSGSSDGVLQTVAYFGFSVYTIIKGNTTVFQRVRAFRRVSEISEVTFNTTRIVFDLQEEANYAAKIQIISTIFIAGILLISNTLMLRQAQQLLIRPLEKTMRVVAQIRHNPLAKIITEREDVTHQGAENENYFIVGVIAKLGKLLQVMVGDAGADIISRNIRREGTINVMNRGCTVDAVFAFFDIRDFTMITERLQEEVMVFVNHVAAAVHKAAHAAGGYPNKNIGDAFLIVWKRKVLEEEHSKAEEDDEGSSPNSPHAKADCERTPKRSSTMKLTREQSKVTRPIVAIVYPALFASLHAIVTVKASEALADYAKAADVPPIRIGCGIHYGWAIEGAVGTNVKIDATYLSPHVNLSARLETATKRYGVDCIMSDVIYKYLPRDLQPYCRLLDRVVLKGIKDPMNIYGVYGDGTYQKMGIVASSGEREIRRKSRAYSGVYSGVDVPVGVAASEELMKSGGSLHLSDESPLENSGRKSSDKSPLEVDEMEVSDIEDPRNLANEMFAGAVAQYLDGDWVAATSSLVLMLGKFPDDVPAKLMIQRVASMANANGEAPADFPGFTQADEK